MINNVCLNRSETEMYCFEGNEIPSVIVNLPQNIDIFSELANIDEGVSEKTRASYHKLLSTIKKNLNEIDKLYYIKNNLSKLRSYIDEDQEIFVEWIIRNNYRIGFSIDRLGIISFWKIYKNDSITNTVSDILDSSNFEEKINDLINEVIYLT